ncbi:MAG TPA: metalloregulator ArsR/SmtB family transcription factor [Thermomicrobiales bacterium]
METHDSLLVRLVDVFKALGDPSRLRILGAVAERPRTGKELADLLAVGAPTVSHHAAKLVDAGLIAVTRDGQSRVYALDEASLSALTRLVASRPAAELPDQTTAGADDAEARERAKVIRDFFDGARLKQIPAQRKKRVIVLQHLLARFEPSRDYPEKEVNATLREAHEDVATLRRELVDYGFMTRSGGVYRVAQALPSRSVHIGQEITGDEHAWLRRLLADATA